LTEFDGINLTFKLLQLRCIQLLHQHGRRFGSTPENPRKRHFPLDRLSRDGAGLMATALPDEVYGRFRAHL
jgi:hypothetical protein